MTKYIIKEIHLTDGQVKKLTAAIAKRRSVSLKINPSALGTLTKLLLTKNQANKYDRKKPFVLNLSAAQITAMSQRIAVDGGFFGPALSVIAKTLLPKILPVLGTLGIAAASGAVHGASEKAVKGSGIVRSNVFGGGIKKIFV